MKHDVLKEAAAQAEALQNASVCEAMHPKYITLNIGFWYDVPGQGQPRIDFTFLEDAPEWAGLCKLISRKLAEVKTAAGARLVELGFEPQVDTDAISKMVASSESGKASYKQAATVGAARSAAKAAGGK